MPQRVTKTDEAYVHKQLKRPHDTSGDIFEIRRIVLNNLGHKVYLMYGVKSPPPFGDVDDEWDETSGAEQDYITAGLYLKADDAKKAVAAYEKEKEKEARTQPQRERLARTEAPARQPPAAPVRAGARPARAAAAGAARALRRIHDGGCDTDEDELIDDEPSPPVDEGAEGAEGAERANDMEEDVVPPSALVMRDRTAELGVAPQPEEKKDEDKSISIIIEMAWFYFAFRESFDRTCPTSQKITKSDGRRSAPSVAPRRRLESIPLSHRRGIDVEGTGGGGPAADAAAAASKAAELSSSGNRFPKTIVRRLWS